MPFSNTMRRLSGTLSMTINKPAGTRWVAVVSDYSCGNVSPPLACLSDYSNTTMKGTLPVTAGCRYFLYVAATQKERFRCSLR